MDFSLATFHANTFMHQAMFFAAFSYNHILVHGAEGADFLWFVMQSFMLRRNARLALTKRVPQGLAGRVT